MLQIAICDDEIKELERTCGMLERYRKQRPELDISLRKFASSCDLLEAIDARGRFDLYLLDVLMPNINGIETGAAIRQKDGTAVLIYLTSSPDYAVASYQVEAHGYLLKPFSEQALFQCLNKAVERLDAEDVKRLRVHTEHGIEAIPFCRLCYAETRNRRLYCHLTDGSTVESLTLRGRFEKMIQPLCRDGRFVQTAAAFIVNMQHIRSVAAKGFVMADGVEAPISRAFAKARKTYLNYLLERGLGE